MSESGDAFNVDSLTATRLSEAETVNTAKHTARNLQDGTALHAESDRVATELKNETAGTSIYASIIVLVLVIGLLRLLSSFFVAEKDTQVCYDISIEDKNGQEDILLHVPHNDIVYFTQSVELSASVWATNTSSFSSSPSRTNALPLLSRVQFRINDEIKGSKSIVSTDAIYNLQEGKIVKISKMPKNADALAPESDVITTTETMNLNSRLSLFLETPVKDNAHHEISIASTPSSPKSED